MNEAYLEFPEGWGVLEKKSLLWGRCGYFLELNILPNVARIKISYLRLDKKSASTSIKGM